MWASAIVQPGNEKPILPMFKKFATGSIPGTGSALRKRYVGISATAPASHERLLWYALSFTVCLVCTPLYFHFIGSAGDAVRNQQIVSSLAFILWAYSLGAGFFKERPNSAL
jgi:hypothetical protein